MIVAANLLAMLIQTLSAKLGIATGRNLPEVCRDELLAPPSCSGSGCRPRRSRWRPTSPSSSAPRSGSISCSGIGLFSSAVVAGIAAFAILELQRFGVRLLEAVIASLVGVIGGCYVVELLFAHPNYSAVFHHAVTPQLGGREAVLLSVGILGATVMPHVIYLHSALTQDRLVPETDERRTDAAPLHAPRRADRDDDRRADQHRDARDGGQHVLPYRACCTSTRSTAPTRPCEPILGGASSVLFALALVASGLSSSAVGTLSGQVVMQGFIRRQIPIAVRRLVTMVPAFVVIAIGLNPTRTLVISQVVLSFGIPFALVPLVWFTSRRDVMGVLVNRRVTTVAASSSPTRSSA